MKIKQELAIKTNMFFAKNAIFVQILIIMTRLLIEIPNIQDARLLLDFAKRLNAVVVKIEESNLAQTPVYWLEQLAEMGSLGEIESPVEWQREIRKDRLLPR